MRIKIQTYIQNKNESFPVSQ